MASVYSVKFVEKLGLSTGVSVPVPNGHVYIVRDIDVYEGATLTPDVIYFEGTLGQAIWFEQSDPTSGLTYGSWRGRQVFTEGQAFTIRPASGAWDVTVSGYDLVD